MEKAGNFRMKTWRSKMRKFLGATLFVIACIVFHAYARAADAVRVGFTIPRTGLFAAGTQTSMNAFELWKDRVNASGGLDVKGTKRPIEFVYYDDQSDANKSAQLYEKLITSDKVDLLLGPWGSPASLAVSGILERYQFPAVVGAASSVKLREIKAGNIFFVSAYFPDKLARMITDLLVNVGMKSAAVVTVQVPYGLEIRNFLVPALKQAGINVMLDEGYPPAVKDMTALLGNVKNANPDAVLVVSFPADTSLYMRQARELNIRAPFQFALIGPTRGWFVNEFGANADGIITIGGWTPNRKEWPDAKPFYDAYVAKFGEKPDYSDSILAYQACEVLAEAVKAAGLDKGALRKTLATATFNTLNGPAKFTGVENTGTIAGLSQYQDRMLQIIWPDSIATSKFIRKPAWSDK
jgi:branched-chain amino acid transport system substrate-binding protein